MFIAPEKRTFENDAVRLVPIRREHLKDLYENTAGDAAEIFYHMFAGPFPGMEEMGEWLQREIESHERVTFAVYSKRLQTHVGVCSIINTDLVHGTSELGSVWYGKAAQRSEINTNAVFLLLQYLFDDLKYRRVVWKCDAANEKSRNAALKLGFTYEGMFRQHLIIKNRNRDTAWYSIIDTEWEQVRMHLHRRIAEKRS